MTQEDNNIDRDEEWSGINKPAKFLWPLIFLALIGSIGYAYLKPVTLTPAQRAQSLESQIKCPACEGQSVENSTAAIAVSIKAQVYQDILKNESDSQILNSLASTYGQAIYLSPHGSSYADLSWIIPLAMISFVIIILFFTFIRRKYPMFSLFRRKQTDSLDIPTKKQKNKVQLIIGFTLIAVGILYFLGLGFGLNLPGKRQNGNSQFTLAQLLQIANFQAGIGDSTDAITTYKQVLTQNPTNVQALTQEGWLISQSGVTSHNKNLIALGQALIQKAISYDNKYFEAHLYLGTIYLLDIRDPVMAADQYQIFLKLNPPKTLLSASKPEIIQAFNEAKISIPVSLNG